MTSEEISVEKAEAEVALEAAIPALEEAAQALNDLKKDDITEIRSFAKPHILVQKVSCCKSPARTVALQPVLIATSTYRTTIRFCQTLFHAILCRHISAQHCKHALRMHSNGVMRRSCERCS